jgi:hypothetical protein
MTGPIIPKDSDGTTSIERVELNLGTIGHTTTSDLRRIVFVPLCGTISKAMSVMGKMERGGDEPSWRLLVTLWAVALGEKGV